MATTARPKRPTAALRLENVAAVAASCRNMAKGYEESASNAYSPETRQMWRFQAEAYLTTAVRLERVLAGDEPNAAWDAAERAQAALRERLGEDA